MLEIAAALNDMERGLLLLDAFAKAANESAPSNVTPAAAAAASADKRRGGALRRGAAFEPSTALGFGDAVRLLLPLAPFPAPGAPLPRWAAKAPSESTEERRRCSKYSL